MADEKKDKPSTDQQSPGSGGDKGSKPTKMSQIVFDHGRKDQASIVINRGHREPNLRPPFPAPTEKKKK